MTSATDRICDRRYALIREVPVYSRGKLVHGERLVLATYDNQERAETALAMLQCKVPGAAVRLVSVLF